MRSETPVSGGHAASPRTIKNTLDRPALHDDREQHNDVRRRERDQSSQPGRRKASQFQLSLAVRG
ncbi:hypothetical protein, partial [uncultured Sphingomonas sp.]|uniref:hypothetical protein n=1 Tax=uncultured Sphingomonas sp. TaxID=158754 RepID=UPI003748BEBA